MQFLPIGSIRSVSFNANKNNTTDVHRKIPLKPDYQSTAMAKVIAIIGITGNQVRARPVNTALQTILIEQ
jgi:hypothetical protein